MRVVKSLMEALGIRRRNKQEPSAVDGRESFST
jgi:hypothetical protein